MKILSRIFYVITACITLIVFSSSYAAREIKLPIVCSADEDLPVKQYYPKESVPTDPDTYLSAVLNGFQAKGWSKKGLITKLSDHLSDAEFRALSKSDLNILDSFLDIQVEAQCVDPLGGVTQEIRLAPEDRDRASLREGETTFIACEKGERIFFKVYSPTGTDKTAIFTITETKEDGSKVSAASSMGLADSARIRTSSPGSVPESSVRRSSGSSDDLSGGSDTSSPEKHQVTAPIAAVAATTARVAPAPTRAPTTTPTTIARTPVTMARASQAATAVPPPPPVRRPPAPPVGVLATTIPGTNATHAVVRPTPATISLTLPSTTATHSSGLFSFLGGSGQSR